MKFPEFPEFHHEAMATSFALVIADQSSEYARQAARVKRMTMSETTPASSSPPATSAR